MTTSHELTLLDVIKAVSEAAENDLEIIATVVHLISSGQVRLHNDAIRAMRHLVATLDAAAQGPAMDHFRDDEGATPFGTQDNDPGWAVWRSFDLSAILPPAGLVGHDDAANEHEFLHIPIAQVESVVKPDAVTDDLRRKAVVLMVCPQFVSTDLEMLWLLSRFGDSG